MIAFSALPTVAGGLVGAFCASQVHLHGVAEASFGVGMLCWLLVGSTILNRLFFHSLLPPVLVPTLAIELAPPAVAGIAYFPLTGGGIDLLARAPAGYALLMILVQVRMLPVFVKLRFGPGFWAFTFSWAATATYAPEWIALRKPAWLASRHSSAACWAASQSPDMKLAPNRKRYSRRSRSRPFMVPAPLPCTSPGAVLTTRADPALGEDLPPCAAISTMRATIWTKASLNRLGRGLGDCGISGGGGLAALGCRCGVAAGPALPVAEKCQSRTPSGISAGGGGGRESNPPATRHAAHWF